jgi:hypothetical protein
MKEKPSSQPPSSQPHPEVYVDFDGVLYEAVIDGLLAFYEPTDTFRMPYGVYTRDELVEEFRHFLTDLLRERDAVGAVGAVGGVGDGFT